MFPDLLTPADAVPRGVVGSLGRCRIGRLEEVGRSTVTIEGTIEPLWVPAHRSQAQVGLIEDDTGKRTVTIHPDREPPVLDPWESK